MGDCQPIARVWEGELQVGIVCRCGASGGHSVVVRLSQKRETIVIRPGRSIADQQT